VLAALSIDLDALEHYHLVHGLPPPPPGPDPVHGAALDRFGELCARLGLHATAFAVGDRLAEPGAAAAVARLAAAGHEIANHGFAHDYAIARRPPAAILADVRRGADAVERAAGRRPAGFRAPGYTLSAPLVRALCDAGVRYDSSAFPSLPYWVAKAAVMGAMALGGRPSGAILDRPRASWAPRVPYHPSASEPYARGALPLLELPIATGFLGFPLVGTFIATFPPGLVRALSAGARALPLLVVELHAIDLLDVADLPEGSRALVARQRDLRVPAAVKAARLAAFVRAQDREWVTLEGAAERLSLVSSGAEAFP
jgi:hypothetical protein